MQQILDTLVEHPIFAVCATILTVMVLPYVFRGLVLMWALPMLIFGIMVDRWQNRSR